MLQIYYYMRKHLYILKQYFNIVFHIGCWAFLLSIYKKRCCQNKHEQSEIPIKVMCIFKMRWTHQTLYLNFALITRHEHRHSSINGTSIRPFIKNARRNLWPQIWGFHLIWWFSNLISRSTIISTKYALRICFYQTTILEY